jgi:hypothetical protein
MNLRKTYGLVVTWKGLEQAEYLKEGNEINKVTTYKQT